MTKGNVAINKNMAKIIDNGRITQELPLILSGGRMDHLFSAISPTNCILCGFPLKFNENYTRYLITANELIAAENAIESTLLYRKILDLAKNSELSEASLFLILYLSFISCHLIFLLAF